jgi:hypothetical protein
MVNVWEGPVHGTATLVKVGVTVIVAVNGAVPGLTAANVPILPAPLAARPIPGVSLVHAYVVVPPVLIVPKLTALMFEPLHTT